MSIQLNEDNGGKVLVVRVSMLSSVLRSSRAGSDRRMIEIMREDHLLMSSRTLGARTAFLSAPDTASSHSSHRCLK